MRNDVGEMVVNRLGWCQFMDRDFGHTLISNSKDAQTREQKKKRWNKMDLFIFLLRSYDVSTLLEMHKSGCLISLVLILEKAATGPGFW